MPLTIANNLASLQAQRQFGRATESLTKINEQLSSGLRINRASDDAAGLAVAESLKVDRRVFLQGLRNVNDAISSVRVFDGALEEMSSIAIRIQELAEQSANGTLGSTQRAALDAEAQALREEAQRIVTTTRFNDLNFFDGSVTELLVQASDSQVQGSLPLLEIPTIFDGTVQAEVAYGTGDAPVPLGVGDINNDGITDIVAANYNSHTVSILLGNGDGTFQADLIADTGQEPEDLALADINGDGNLDFVTGNTDSTTVSIALGNGDGTFANDLTFTTGNRPESVGVGDFDGDGNLDVVVGNRIDDNVMFPRFGGVLA